MTYEATNPKYFAEDHVVRISGLITCLGIVAQNGRRTGTVAGHFVTPVTCKGTTLTDEGRSFLDKVVKIMEDQEWGRSTTTVTCYYAPRLDGKVWPETKNARTAVKEYLEWEVESCATSSTFHIKS